MSKLKEQLKARKKQLEDQLKLYEPLKEELAEVIKALKALEPKKKKDSCTGCAGGCDVCRTGWYYR